MKKLILLLLFTLSGLFVNAQVKFEAHAPLSAGAGDRFIVEFSLINGEGTNFSGPTVSGAEVIAGPSLSTGTEITIINGKQSSTTTQKYTYVLVAGDSGSVKIGAASVLAKGQSYTTKPISVDIVAGGAKSGGSNTNSKGGFSASDALLKMEVSKTDVFKGEAIVATLKLYTRVPIVGVEDVKYAKFNGFWTQELTFDNQNVSRATLDGKAYTAQIVRQWLVFPQKSGTLEIEQNEFTVVAQITLPSSGGGSLFDDFFGDMGRTEMVKRKLIASPVKIRVKELPKPEPATFQGAVGKFTMESSISSNSLPANSGGNITIKINGSGNFPLITAPDIVFPAGIEKYDVKVNDAIKYQANGASGTRSYEYPFITRAEGRYVIDNVDFTYFDVDSKSYKTLNTGSFNLEITKGDGSTATQGAFISGVTKEDLKMLGQDIRFIKVGEAQLVERNNKFLWSWSYFLVMGIIIFGFAGVLVALRKYLRQRADVARVKHKKANKVALKRLKRSNSYMVSNDKDKFYEEMLRALWGYIGDKLAIEVADLTKERVKESLVSRGVGDDQAEAFLNLISQCEYAQYSPSSDDNMAILYNSALDIIGNMEVK